VPKIEIDNEVFDYLKAKAEPFVDTPNSVLRRELFGRKTAPPGRTRPTRGFGSETTPGQISFAMPEALRQILEVVEIVRRRRRSRTEATLEVALHHNIARETVADKYGRQLGLNTSSFDALLGERSLKGLQDRLQKQFPMWKADIEKTLRSLSDGGS
jgi:hypothetical protein